MKVISTKDDYYSLAVNLEKILNVKKSLPENVFVDEFKFFLFVTFDELFIKLFFNRLMKYLSAVYEEKFWLTSIDPDPSLYFGENFDFWGSVEFFNSDTVDDYLAALNKYPECSPADALAHNADLLMFFSSTCKWAIYGSRDADIGICAFKDRTQMDLFRSIYGDDILDGVKAAANYAYGTSNADTLNAKFCRSYL